MIYPYAMEREMKIMWIIMAGLSAVFAAISTILAKCGTQKTDPDIATTLRTVAVLLCAWLMAAWAGSINTLSDISVKTLIFLLFGGITNAASWIYYYRALSVSTIDKVMPIEKASILLTTIAAIIMFHETNHIFQKLAGVAVILIGVFLICGKECFSENAENNHSWFGQAVLASVFAALNTIISKLGINGIESNLGTAVNISAVLAVMAGILLCKGKAGQIRKFEIKEFLLPCYPEPPPDFAGFVIFMPSSKDKSRSP